ncbi:MAG TPA: RIP metalloprotease RseP [Saprospiraceae bacterium]|nr:RIP metalloprotease RseP [Saprospiraceae bacterium]
MNVLSIIVQLLVSLSILVVLHELGHFIPAKLFKTRIEKFYLFFDPWFSLVRKKIGDTVYGIGWLPLGGYVKIAGMVDESLDMEQMKQPPQPWEFRSKKTWQRLIIMLGGVTVNFILGFLIFGLMLFAYGEQFLPAKNLEYGIAVDSLGYQIGLRDGDHILKVGEKTFEQFNPATLVRGIVIDNAKDITVKREGATMTVPVDPKYVGVLSSYKSQRASILEPRIPFVIKEVLPNSPAQAAGLQKGDRLIAFAGGPTPYYQDFVKKLKGSKEKEVEIGYQRGQAFYNARITPTAEGIIGVGFERLDYYFDFERREYTLLQALPAGVSHGWVFLVTQLKAFGQIFKGKIKATESLGGFGTIAQLFPESWDWEIFWRNTAYLSLILAFMNLLPIPALDGGHVMFLIYEAVTGRKPGDKFMEYSTIIGFALVLGLVLFANGLDVWRWVTSRF